MADQNMADQNFEVFGTTEKGETVYRVRISGGGLTASVITWGAVIQDLRLEGHQPPLVLGFERFEDYLNHSPISARRPAARPIAPAVAVSRWMASRISWK